MRRTQGSFHFRNTKNHDSRLNQWNTGLGRPLLKNQEEVQKNQKALPIHLHNLYSMTKKGVAAAKRSDVRAPPKEAKLYWMHKRSVAAAERSDVRAPPKEAKHRSCA